jgi:hypothetical protein
MTACAHVAHGSVCARSRRQRVRAGRPVTLNTGAQSHALDVINVVVLPLGLFRLIPRLLLLPSTSSGRYLSTTSHLLSCTAEPTSQHTTNVCHLPSNASPYTRTCVHVCMCVFFLVMRMYIASATQSKAEVMAAEAKGRSAYSHNEILLPHNLLPPSSPWPEHLPPPGMHPPSARSNARTRTSCSTMSARTSWLQPNPRRRPAQGAALLPTRATPTHRSIYTRFSPRTTAYTPAHPTTLRSKLH